MSLFNKNKLFGLPSLRNSEKLKFNIQKQDGSIVSKEFLEHENYDSNIMFDMKKYLYGDVASYYFTDGCLIYNNRTLQSKFEDIIKSVIMSLENEDLSYVNIIIVDIRGNTGGNSKLNEYLINYLKKHSDKKLICLTDYRVFSGGRYALIDLIKLGAITIGEGISTPFNCYGNSNWKQIDGHWFSSSESYLNPIMKWGTSSKSEYKNRITSELKNPIIFCPDILVNEEKQDYINGIDTIMNYAINYSKNNKMARKM